MSKKLSSWHSLRTADTKQENSYLKKNPLVISQIIQSLGAVGSMNQMQLFV